MSKLPSFQFYPGDWMKAPELRAVSVAARGLWMDMLCLMFEGSRRGYLQHPTGQPFTAEQIARAAGLRPTDAARLLAELEGAGVFSRDERGVIYSRRLRREEEARANTRERVYRHRHRNPEGTPGTPPSNGGVTPEKRGSNRHSSSSSSSSVTSSKLSLSPPAPSQPLQVARPQPRERESSPEVGPADREAYAEARGMGDGWLVLSADGRFDVAVRKWKLAKARAPASGELVCPKDCACGGTGWVQLDDCSIECPEWVGRNESAGRAG